MLRGFSRHIMQKKTVKDDIAGIVKSCSTSLMDCVLNNNQILFYNAITAGVDKACNMA
jgi:hypothetical protein